MRSIILLLILIPFQVFGEERLILYPSGYKVRVSHPAIKQLKDPAITQKIFEDFNLQGLFSIEAQQHIKNTGFTPGDISAILDRFESEILEGNNKNILLKAQIISMETEAKALRARIHSETLFREALLNSLNSDVKQRMGATHLEINSKPFENINKHISPISEFQ